MWWRWEILICFEDCHFLSLHDEEDGGWLVVGWWLVGGEVGEMVSV